MHPCLPKWPFCLLKGRSSIQLQVKDQYELVIHASRFVLPMRTFQSLRCLVNNHHVKFTLHHSLAPTPISQTLAILILTMDCNDLPIEC